MPLLFGHRPFNPMANTGCAISIVWRVSDWQNSIFTMYRVVNTALSPTHGFSPTAATK